MKRMKRLTALVLTLCMLFTLAPIASAANGTIKMTLNSNTMTVNGVNKAIDSDPAIKSQVKKDSQGNGYTMLPLRAVVEAMGGTVAYDAATKVITMTYNGTTVKHTIGTKTATVNGVSKTMAIASYAANNRTYVHLRAIELLSASIKVDWVASSQSVTITYPQTTASNGIKTVNLTIKNSCATSYLQFTALQLAPAGSTTYSGNLLNGTLILGGTRVLNMSIQPGKYDLKGTDINGNTFTWKNLDFTQVQSSAVLTLTSGALYTLSIDNALTGTASSNVTVYNNTGAIITKIQAFQSTSTTPTEVYSGNLYSGSYTQIPLPYGTGNNVYYLTVTFANGGQITYNYITVDGSYMTIALRGDGTFTYGGVTTGDGVYFVNRTGSNIKTLEMKLGKAGNWSADLVDGTLKPGDYILLDNVSTSELRNMTVYFRTSSSGNGKSVEVASSLKNSIVFYYGSSLGVEYNVDPSDVTYEEGLFLYNDTGIDFDEFYVINTDMVDTDDYPVDDFTKPEHWFEDEDATSAEEDDGYEDYEADNFWDKTRNFDDGDEILITEWDAEDLAKATLVFWGVDDTTNYYGEATVGKASKFDYNVYMELDLDSSYDIVADITYDYTEDDDWSDYETGLLVYNNTSKDINYIYFANEELTSSNCDDKYDDYISNLDEDEYDFAEEYDDYDKDCKNETIYYYVDFDGTGDYAGSFKPDKSNKDNVCLIINGADVTGSSTSKDKLEYDWYYDDESELDSATLWIYNNTGYDYDLIWLGIDADSAEDAETDADTNDDDAAINSGDFDYGDLMEVEGVDYDDIYNEYIYIEGEGENNDDEDFDDDEKISDDFDYVLLEMYFTSGGNARLKAYYDNKADEFLEEVGYYD